MKTIKLVFLIGLAAMITWSCTGPTSSDNNGFANAPYTRAMRVPIGGNNTAKMDSANVLAKKIPGFGGIFIDQSNRFSIYLTDPAEQKARARQILANSETITQALARLRAEGEKYQSVSVANMRTKRGQYTFNQLYSWKKSAAGKAFSIDGVYASGIDQSQNKISVGVKNKSVKNRVTDKLAQLDIPLDAVMIYQMTKPEFLIGH